MLDNEVEPVIICRKCRITRICFDGSRRGPHGKLVPMNFHNPEQIHEYDQSYSFPCKNCNEQIYLDKKVLSPSGRRIPLSAIDGRPHDCTEKK